MRRAFLLLAIAITAVLVVACRAPAEVAPTSAPLSSATATATGNAIRENRATAAPATPAASPTNAIQENRATATPIYAGPLSLPCGLSLPALPADGPAASSVTLTG